MTDSHLDLIEVRWIWDEVEEQWVLVATEAPVRGRDREPVDHWMKDQED